MGTLFYDSMIESTSTKSGEWSKIPGLQIDIPGGYITGTVIAVATLNITSPYAVGSDYPGIEFSLWQGFPDPQITIASGVFTSSFQNPQSAGRFPFTIMGQLMTPAPNTACTIVAMWKSVRGSTCVIDKLTTPGASITCLIESTTGA